MNKRTAGAIEALATTMPGRPIKVIWRREDDIQQDSKESNFHDYRVTRMSDVPPIEIIVISTDNPPTGIGEAGVPVVSPAIANAS